MIIMLDLIWAYCQAYLFQSFKHLPSTKSCQVEFWKLIIITVYDNLHILSVVVHSILYHDVNASGAIHEKYIGVGVSSITHRSPPTAHLPNASMEMQVYDSTQV